MPAGREKVYHSVGAVCNIALDIRNSPYTGVLKNGRHQGIIRLGPTKYLENGKGLIHGASIKIFRSSRSSANLLFFEEGDLFDNLRGSGTENFNFFAYSLSNHVSGCKKQIAKAIVRMKLGEEVGCFTKLGLSDASTYDQDGQMAENIQFPFKVYPDNYFFNFVISE